MIIGTRPPVKPTTNRSSECQIRPMYKIIVRTITTDDDTDDSNFPRGRIVFRLFVFYLNMRTHDGRRLELCRRTDSTKQ